MFEHFTHELRIFIRRVRLIVFTVFLNYVLKDKRYPKKKNDKDKFCYLKRLKIK